MYLQDICRPIENELKLVEEEYGKTARYLASKGSADILEHFFKNKGKYLRPILVLLSANAAAGGNGYDEKNNRISLAVACELMHSASLIHDDIIDGSETRRGQATLNAVFGSKLAVLTGDLLNAQTFLLLAGTGRMDIMKVVCSTAEKMCNGEIKEMRFHKYSGLTEYLEMIEGKTAVFMAACCRCGAMLATKDEIIISSLETFGMNAGMAYQLIDDYLDGDSGVEGVSSLRQSENYSEKAKEALNILPSSVYKDSLYGLIDYFMHCTKVGNAG